MKSLVYSLVLLFFTPILCLQASMATAKEPYQLVGEARLSVLFWDVYDAQLFSEDGRYRGLKAPLKLQLSYLRKIEREELLEATREELRQVAPDLPAERVTHQLLRLEQLWPAKLRKGDQLSFELTDHGGSFYFNQQHLGSIDDHDFARAFIAIWLHERSSFPTLSRKLRGEP